MYLLLSKVCNFGFSSLSKAYHKSIRVFFAVLLAFTLTACGPVTVATIAVVAVLINSDDGSSSSTSSNSTVFTITSNTVANSIDENSGAGQTVYTVTSNDNTATYSLSGVDSSKFTINTSTGIVILTDNPDFEDQSSYSFIVTATDTVGNSSSNTITLAINNIALAPFNLSSITASSTDIKEMTLIWSLAAEHADDSSSITYSLCEKDTSQGNNCNELTSVTNELTTTTTISSLVSALSTDYFILASSGDEFESSSELNIGTDEISKMIGYVKASNSEEFDSFSGSDDTPNTSIALSGDGHTLAVGAPEEDNDDTGIKTNDEENSESNTLINSGAVYLYSNNINSNNTSGKWIKTAYIKASNAGLQDFFGISVALNYDGTALAVGAYIEDNAHPGVINGVQGADDGVANNSGAVYVFTNVNDTWTQSAYIKPAIVGASDEFGYSLSLNGDATVLAVGAYQEDSNATGVTTTAGSDIAGATGSGAVYIFSNDGSTWTQDAYVKASNTGNGDNFSRSLSLSSDGKTLAVGAWFEDDDASDSGAVYLFTDDGSSWTQADYIKASNAEAYAEFGRSLSLNDDGTLLAVSAYLEDNSFTGIIDGSAAITNSGIATDSGAVYLYSYDGSAWNQTTYFKASNADDTDGFGYHIALSGDGNSLIVGSYLEDNDVTGIITGGDVTTDNNSSSNSGAVYLFTNDGSSWAQTAYIKASNTGIDDKFGTGVAISNDGTTLAVGAADESNSATGIITDGSEITGDDGFAESSGAVYIY